MEDYQSLSHTKWRCEEQPESGEALPAEADIGADMCIAVTGSRVRGEPGACVCVLVWFWWYKTLTRTKWPLSASGVSNFQVNTITLHA